MTGIEQAVEKAGGRRALASALGVTEQAIAQWVARGWVPPARAPQIETLYEVQRRELVKPSLAAVLFPE